MNYNEQVHATISNFYLACAALHRQGHDFVAPLTEAIGAVAAVVTEDGHAKCVCEAVHEDIDTAEKHYAIVVHKQATQRIFEDAIKHVDEAPLPADLFGDGHHKDAMITMAAAADRADVALTAMIWTVVGLSSAAGLKEAFDDYYDLYYTNEKAFHRALGVLRASRDALDLLKRHGLL